MMMMMMMDKFFEEEIRGKLEVYMDDIIVKHLTSVVHQVRQHNMRLNLEKYTFRVRARKFVSLFFTDPS